MLFQASLKSAKNFFLVPKSPLFSLFLQKFLWFQNKAISL